MLASIYKDKDISHLPNSDLVILGKIEFELSNSFILYINFYS